MPRRKRGGASRDGVERDGGADARAKRVKLGKHVKPGSVRADAPADWLEKLPPREELTRDVLEVARAQGFAAVGVAPAGQSTQGEHLAAWLAAGAHSTMEFMAKDVALRVDPRGHLADTRAFLMVMDAYASREDGEGLGAADVPPGHGGVARYARGRNYHEVMKKRLHALADALRLRYPGSDFRSFVDTAPVLERELAMLAGLGWQAKNTMLIHPRLGSYVLLAGAATNLPLVVTPAESRVADACGSCTRCIDACPTDALDVRRLDARKCISYLTIERQEPIATDLHAKMGAWVYGCDICQEVCPHNSPREVGVVGARPHEQYEGGRSSFDLLEVMRWDEAARREAFVNSAMKRAPLVVMRRNAIIAAANAVVGDARLEGAQRAAIIEQIARIAADANEPELVRQTAAESLARISGATR
jgi:epoxyqueuosine reductase